MYGIVAPLIGALITIMNGVNSRFSSLAGAAVSALVIHAAGLCALALVFAVRRDKRPATRLPAYLYLGGFVGVGTVFGSNYAFSVLDASLAVALALIGQTLFSIAADAAGFLGRERRALSARRLPGVLMAVAGAAFIVRDWRSGALGMAVAFGSGLTTGLNAVLNAEHGRRRGMLRSTLWNYLTGITLSAVIVAASRPSVAEAARSVAAAGPLLALGGGVMGVVVVTSMNVVFSRLSAFQATLLLFSGQALTGVVLDAAASGAFDLRKLAGTALVVAGLAVDAALGRRKAAAQEA